MRTKQSNNNKFPTFSLEFLTSQDGLERDINCFLLVPRHSTKGSYDLWASVRWQSFAICKICIFKAFLPVCIVTLTTSRLLFLVLGAFVFRSTIKRYILEAGAVRSNSFDFPSINFAHGLLLTYFYLNQIAFIDSVVH